MIWNLKSSIGYWVKDHNLHWKTKFYYTKQLLRLYVRMVSNYEAVPQVDKEDNLIFFGQWQAHCCKSNETIHNDLNIMSIKDSIKIELENNTRESWGTLTHWYSRYFNNKPTKDRKIRLSKNMLLGAYLMDASSYCHWWSSTI